MAIMICCPGCQDWLVWNRAVIIQDKNGNLVKHIYRSWCQRCKVSIYLVQKL